VQAIPVSNDVPFRQDRTAALRDPRRLNIEFLVGFEMVGEFAGELVGHDSAVVIPEAVLPRLAHLEVIEPPDMVGYKSIYRF